MTAVPLRIATYNVRKAMGNDRRRDPDRVLEVVAGLDADVVALQEADFRLPPRRPVFAADEIELRTGMRPVSFGHGRDSLGWHGNALLLSPRVAVTGARHHDLPGLEPRGCVEAELTVEGREFRAFGVHLGLLRSSRRIQLTALLGLLGGTALPTLIAGDFNERSETEGLGRLARQFRILSGGPTYHARMPMFALDRIAVSDGFGRAKTRVLRTAQAALASDHLPLVADLELRRGGRG